VAMSTVSLPLAVPPVVFAFVGLAAASFSGAVGDVLASVQFRTLLQTVTPNRFIGRVEGTQSVLRGVAGLMGAFLGGVLGSSIGIRFTMWIAVAVAIVFLLVVGHFALRRHREAVQVGEAEPSLPA
jgi:MFS family permease